MVNYLTFFLGFAPFFKTAKESPIKIDNLGFKLFYRFTAGFMFLSTAFCGMSEMFGKNIECFSQEGKVSAAPNIVNQYCFVRNIIIIGVIIHSFNSKKGYYYKSYHYN